MGVAFWKIRSKVWSGETGRALRKHPADVRELFIYLCSNDAANPFGVYHIEPDMMALQTGRSEASVAHSLDVLAQLDAAHYDTKGGYVWVKEMAAQQLDAPLLPKDRKVAWSKKWYATSPPNVWLGPFYDRYVIDLRLTGESPVERRDVGVHRSYAPVTSIDVMGDGTAAVATGPPDLFGEATQLARPDRSWVRATFDRFYEIYPRKESRKVAFQAWTRIKGLNEGLADHIINSLARQLPNFNYEDGGTRIPHPSTWINQERWGDSVREIPSVSRRTQNNLRAVAQASKEIGR